MLLHTHAHRTHTARTPHAHRTHTARTHMSARTTDAEQVETITKELTTLVQATAQVELEMGKLVLEKREQEASASHLDLNRALCFYRMLNILT